MLDTENTKIEDRNSKIEHTLPFIPSLKGGTRWGGTKIENEIGPRQLRWLAMTGCRPSRGKIVRGRIETHF